MINLDDRVLDKVNESEMWVILHVAKRMRSNRMAAWPALETIAKDCKWSLNSTRKWRDSLVNKGILTIETRSGSSNIYRFNLDGVGVFTPMNGDYQEEAPLPNIGTPPLPNIGTPPLPNIGTPPLPNIGTPPLPNIGTPPLPNIGTQKGINNKWLTNEGRLKKEDDTSAANAPVVDIPFEEEKKKKKDAPGPGAATSWTKVAAIIFDEVGAELSKAEGLDYIPFNWKVCNDQNFAHIKNLRKLAIEPDFKNKMGHEANDEEFFASFRAVMTLSFKYFRKIQKETNGALHYTPESIYRSYNKIKTFKNGTSNNGNSGDQPSKFGQGGNQNGKYDPAKGY